MQRAQQCRRGHTCRAPLTSVRHPCLGSPSDDVSKNTRWEGYSIRKCIETEHNSKKSISFEFGGSFEAVFHHREEFCDCNVRRVET